MSPEDISTRVEHALFIRSFFAISPPARVVLQMTASLQELRFSAGETIFEIGDSTEMVYFVVSGKVVMESAAKERWEFDKHSLVGIGDAMAERPRQRKAWAATDVHALGIGVADYFDVMEDNFDFAQNAMITVCGNMHALSIQLAPDGVFLASPDDAFVPVEPDREDLNLIERTVVLHESVLLQNAPIQSLVSLARHAERHRWRAGEVIFEADQPSRTLVFVARGSVRVTRETPRVDQTVGASAMIGEHAALGFPELPYRAVAVTDAMTLSVEKELFFDLAEDHFGLARATFAYVGRENERARDAILRQREATTSLGDGKKVVPELA